VGEMTAAVVLRRGLQVLKDGSGFARLTRGCGGEPIRAERASDSLKPSGAHLATKARYAPIGDRAGIGRDKQGIENCEQRVVRWRAYNRQRREPHALLLGAAPRERSTALHPLLGGVREPAASPLVSQNGWAARSRHGMNTGKRPGLRPVATASGSGLLSEKPAPTTLRLCVGGLRR
jgi:hypothetical protein